jgi:hypothetical protein
VSSFRASKSLWRSLSEDQRPPSAPAHPCSKYAGGISLGQRHSFLAASSSSSRSICSLLSVFRRVPGMCQSEVNRTSAGAGEKGINDRCIGHTFSSDSDGWTHSDRMIWPPPKIPLSVLVAASIPRFSTDWAAAREKDKARRSANEAR